MSNLVIEDDTLRWIFGWNQKNLSFFLIKHDKRLPPEENPVFSWGTEPYQISDPDQLFVLAELVGLGDIPADQKLPIYRAKDIETRTKYIVYYHGEFDKGFPANTEAHSASLAVALRQVRKDRQVRVRKIIEEMG